MNAARSEAHSTQLSGVHSHILAVGRRRACRRTRSQSVGAMGAKLCMQGECMGGQRGKAVWRQCPREGSAHSARIYLCQAIRYTHALDKPRFHHAIADAQFHSGCRGAAQPRARASTGSATGRESSGQTGGGQPRPTARTRARRARSGTAGGKSGRTRTARTRTASAHAQGNAKHARTSIRSFSQMNGGYLQSRSQQRQRPSVTANAYPRCNCKCIRRSMN